MRTIQIRAEQPADAPSVRAVNIAAFGQAEEADLVDALRRSVTPLISLVAVQDDHIIGHVAFTPVTVEQHGDAPLMMGLAPMAVSPDHQRRGVGTALGERGLQACRELGAVAVIVLGHPTYYPRFGFKPASGFGLRYPVGVSHDAFMALELVPGALRDIEGVVHFAPPFEAVS